MRIRSVATMVLGLVLPMALTSCSKDDAVERFLETRRDALVERRAHCAPNVSASAMTGLPNEARILQGSHDAGRLVFREDEVERCLQAISAMTCWDLYGARLPSECGEVFDPRVAPGGDCHSSFECVGGWCDEEASCPGRCVAFANEGAPCGESRCDSEAGLYCDTDDSVCRDRLAVGAACRFDFECGETPNCDPTHHCAPAEPVVSEGGYCFGLECAPGLHCEGNALAAFNGGTCVASPAPAVGDVCRWEDGCGTALVCAGLVEQAHVYVGQCAAWSEEGGPCAEVSGLLTGCKYGLLCVGGRCEEPPRSGPCAQGYGVLVCHPTSTCVGGQCVPKAAAGVVCRGGDECASGVCVGVCVDDCIP